MTLWKQLIGTEAVAMGWLIALAGAMAAYGALNAALSPGMFNPGGSAQIGFLGTFVYGVIPVTLYGAPLYVWLSRRGRANWLSVSAISLVPALLLLFVQFGLGVFVFLCATLVACLTHLTCRKWVGPNNSFKPKPLRGSA